MKQLLAEIARRQAAYVELRYQEHRGLAVMAQKGRIDQASASTTVGVAVRALVDGCWGFSCTSLPDRASIERAIVRAVDAARELAKSRAKRIGALAPAVRCTEDCRHPSYDDLAGRSVEEKIAAVRAAEAAVLKESARIHTAAARYGEGLERRVFASSDGACCESLLARSEFRAAAYAGKGADQQCAVRAAGVCGTWDELFGHPACRDIAGRAAREAVDLLSAPHAEGGVKTVILEPSMVGLLCHEAVGHTVEAEFVQAGSVAAGKLGLRVASDLVTLCDSGRPEIGSCPGGFLPFDDEGAPCQGTTIIEKGILLSYLHNRESAAEFAAPPRGNARAWGHGDEPIIRMTNTYMLPGTSTLEEMLAASDGALLIGGAGGGQADANGEFMFSCNCAHEIRGGKPGRMLKDVTLSGVAFEVLKTVDMVSRDFLFDLGSGHCGKGQPAKVDAGGPYVRCRLVIGGRQGGGEEA